MKRLPMVERFQFSRWTQTRMDIYDMEVGDILTFPAAERFNVGASVARLNEAYEGTRKWKYQLTGARGARLRATNVIRIK